MVVCMRTTIDISDALFHSAKKVTQRDGVSLRALVEEGLRKILLERGTEPPKKLRKGSFKGVGMNPDLEEGDWEKIRSLIYRGRGV